MRDIDTYEKDYIENYSFESVMVRYRRKQVLECLSQYPHKRILEVGCGLEPLFEHVKDYTEYYIVEPSKKFYNNAVEKIKNSVNYIYIYNNFIEKLTLPTFDFIILSSLLHEVEDPLVLLKSIKSLCHKDTVLHINVPNAFSLHNQLAVKMGLIAHIFDKSKLAQTMQRHSTFNIHSLTEFVQHNCFQVVSDGGYFLKPFTQSQLQAMLTQGIIDDKVLDALYEVGKDQWEQASEIYVNVKLNGQ